MNKSIYILFIALALSATATGCSEPAQASSVVVDEAADMPTRERELPEAGTAEPIAEAEPVVPVQPAPIVEPEGPELRSVDDVSVRRMLLARAIEEREPVAPSTEFRASSDRLYAFFDLRNGSEDEATFLVTFDGPDGRSAGHVELTVPGEVGRWRTWAYTRNATEPGEWVAQLHDVDGNLLASQEFTIE